MNQDKKSNLKNQPLVSVIIPCYNGEKFIAEAVESVLNQTYQNWELIIVNDGSTDSSEKIIKEFCKKDKRVRYIKNNENKGIPATRNIGIKESNGEYIALLDQDDLWLPAKLEKQVKYFEIDKELKIGLIFSDILWMREGKISRNSRLSRKIFKNLDKLSCEEVFEILFMNNFIPIISVLVRKQCFSTLGLFDEKLLGGADDHDFVLRLASNFNLKYIEYPLAIRRIHKDNYSRMERFFKDEMIIIEKILKGNKKYSKLKRLKMANLYYAVGREYQIEEHFTRARESYFEAIKINPLNIKCVLCFIICHFGRFGNFILKIFTKIKLYYFYLLKDNNRIFFVGFYF